LAALAATSPTRPIATTARTEAIEIVFDPQQISHGRVYWLARRRSSRSSASVILTA
jgi:hypothetical protein